MAARSRKPVVLPEPKATPAEVAAYLRKTEGTLANWRTQGRGPRWTKPGGSILYAWPDVFEWEKTQPQGGAGVRRGAA